jgi:hypothetical protein
MAAQQSESRPAADSDESNDSSADLDGILTDLASMAPDVEEVDLFGSLDQIAAASALGARLKGCPQELRLNDDNHFVLHEGMLTKVGTFEFYLVGTLFVVYH